MLDLRFSLVVETICQVRAAKPNLGVIEGVREDLCCDTTTH